MQQTPTPNRQHHHQESTNHRNDNGATAQFLVLGLMGISVPLGLIFWFGTSWIWLGLGAIAWVIAVVLKVFLGWGVDALSERSFKSQKAKAAIWGVWSSACELGVTAAVFLFAYPSLENAIGFGVGAGVVELFYLLLQQAVKTKTASSNQQNEATQPSKDRFMEWSGVIERSLALIGHVSSRGLIWLGIRALYLTPFLLSAILLFSIVDGVATYGVSVGWDWTNSSIYKRFTRWVSIVGAVEVILFALGVLLLNT